MKKVVIGLVLGALVGAAGAWLMLKPHKHETAQGAPETAVKPGEKKILYYRNPMNPEVTSPVPKQDEMGMDYVPVYAETVQTPVAPGASAVHVSPAFEQKIGVVTEEVKKRSLAREIRTSGIVDFDERRVYTVTTKVMGWADKLYANYTGALIKKGQPLFELYSPDLVSAQNEYLQSLTYLKSMQESGSEESIKTAEQMVQSARKRLLNWDIPEGEIAALEKTGTARKYLTIYSPDDGFVVDKMVLEGQQVMPGMALYKIANLSRVWVMGDIYQYELAWVKIGQEAEVDLSYLPGRKFSGTVTYISPTIDEATKTAKLRVEIANTPGFELKPGMFATVVITSALPEPVVAVPEQAIIRSGERNLAVVALGNGYFEPREVELGVSGGGYVQAVSGISEGELIVVSSQFLIDSESNLKAAVQQMTLHQGSTVVPAPAQGATAEKPMQQMHNH